MGVPIGPQVLLYGGTRGPHNLSYEGSHTSLD
jgi:hypothetical protein